ncbi:MAG: hypothetical protein QM791_10975 [Ferruginibacter sp.]
MEQLPSYISISFMLVTFLTVFIFYRATGNSIKVLIILCAWLVVQLVTGLAGFYFVTDTIPPRFAFTIIPPVIVTAVLLISKKGKDFINKLDLKMLVLLHCIRIPVELILFSLYKYKTIPELMTFEGRNFDILAGLSAPIIYYFGFVKNSLSKKAIIAWNFICLGLLTNIVINAILAAPFGFQQFAFEQPNVAILHFPFVWLPACVVPLVLLAHLASVYRLMEEIKETRERNKLVPDEDLSVLKTLK